MKGHAREIKIARGCSSKKAHANGEAEVIAAISAMPEPDRVMAERVYALIREHAPSFVPITWHGMPA